MFFLLFFFMLFILEMMYRLGFMTFMIPVYWKRVVAVRWNLIGAQPLLLITAYEACLEPLKTTTGLVTYDGFFFLLQAIISRYGRLPRREKRIKIVIMVTRHMESMEAGIKLRKLTRLRWPRLLRIWELCIVDKGSTRLPKR